MRFIGIDVQINRDCPWVVLTPDGVVESSGWLPSREAPAPRLAELVARVGAPDVWVAIDAPRMPLPSPRPHSFGRGRWHPSQASSRGRHCEVVVKALGLGNPQWTPLAHDAPPWMILGFDLFEAAREAGRTLETFPSASYRAWAADGPDVRLSLTAFAPGPKDMLDAVACALTARCLHRGEGVELGGGDGLGTIVLPRRLTDDEAGHPVHHWPSS